MILKEKRIAYVAWWRCIGNNRNALEGVGHLNYMGLYIPKLQVLCKLQKRIPKSCSRN